MDHKIVRGLCEIEQIVIGDKFRIWQEIRPKFGVSGYDRDNLMSADYDESDLAAAADEKIRTFQADAAREAGIRHIVRLSAWRAGDLPHNEMAVMHGDIDDLVSRQSNKHGSRVPLTRMKVMVRMVCKAKRVMKTTKGLARDSIASI